MDELLGKKIPYSSQAEQAVIGSMLIDPRCIAEVVKKLRADEFYVRGPSSRCSLSARRSTR